MSVHEILSLIACATTQISVRTTFVLLFCDDATSSKRPGCDDGTNLRLRDFAVVPLMPTRVIEYRKIKLIQQFAC